MPNRFQLILRRLLRCPRDPDPRSPCFLTTCNGFEVPATLDLLEDLLSQPDLHHLLVIGAYRDDEVTPTHPLMRRLAAIRQNSGRCRKMY